MTNNSFNIRMGMCALFYDRFEKNLNPFLNGLSGKMYVYKSENTKVKTGLFFKALQSVLEMVVFAKQQ